MKKIYQKAVQKFIDFLIKNGYAKIEGKKFIVTNKGVKYFSSKRSK